MRPLVSKDKVVEFCRRFGEAAGEETRVYLTGGATAVLKGWRASTVDIDIHFLPELNELYRVIPDIKERLEVNIELAAPCHFIPAVPGWEDRSEFIMRSGKATFLHYDLYSQALAKIERGHERDLQDVRMMMESGLVDPQQLIERFRLIEPEIYRYPAIDKATFAAAVARAVEEFKTRKDLNS